MIMRRLLLASLLSLGVAIGAASFNPARINAEDSLVDWAGTDWDVEYWNLPNPNQYLNSPPNWDTNSVWSDSDFSQSKHLTGSSFYIDNGMNAPEEGVQADRFMGQYYTRVDVLQPPKLKFKTISDDGVRVIVHNSFYGKTVVIDEWNDHSASEHFGEVAVPSGSLQIWIQYYENGYDSVIGVDITAEPSGEQGPGRADSELIISPVAGSESGAVVGDSFVYTASAYLNVDYCVYDSNGFRTGCPNHSNYFVDGLEYQISLINSNGIEKYSYQAPMDLSQRVTPSSLSWPFCYSSPYSPPKVCLPFESFEDDEYTLNVGLSHTKSTIEPVSISALITKSTEVADDSSVIFSSSFNPSWELQKWGSIATTSVIEGGQSVFVESNGGHGGARLASPKINVTSGQSYMIDYTHLASVANEVVVREFNAHGDTVGYKWVGYSPVQLGGTSALANYEYLAPGNVESIEIYIELRVHGEFQSRLDEFSAFTVSEL